MDQWWENCSTYNLEKKFGRLRQSTAILTIHISRVILELETRWMTLICMVFVPSAVPVQQNLLKNIPEYADVNCKLKRGGIFFCMDTNNGRQFSLSLSIFLSLLNYEIWRSIILF